MAQQQEQSNKINPELSVLNQKHDLKKIEDNVSIMKNRVELLRNQLQRQKDHINKNKQLTKATIKKKLQVNEINRYKSKDHSQQLDRIENLRNRNQTIRLSHEKQLQNIQKAIYLVKLDDAREVKNVSMEHQRRLKQMNREFLSGQKEKKKKIFQQSNKAKERYMQYWKQKLTTIYTQQAQSIYNISKEKQVKKNQLKGLQEEQIKLLDQINKYHSQEVQTKKQYLAAMSLPVKEVVEAIGTTKKTEKIHKKNKSMLDQYSIQNKYEHINDKNSIKLPNARVNQEKLKIILQQLKKIDHNIQSR